MFICFGNNKPQLRPLREPFFKKRTCPCDHMSMPVKSWSCFVIVRCKCTMQKKHMMITKIAIHMKRY